MDDLFEELLLDMMDNYILNMTLENSMEENQLERKDNIKNYFGKSQIHRRKTSDVKYVWKN